ncbi:MAG: creatininase family protein [Nitrospirae bacterium]|nr:MAG: creatininase family protein [Nitrospirota bacterium]
MYLEEMTMNEFSETLKGCNVALVPFGTLEEHGSHLPLNTDTLVVVEVLKRIASLEEVFVLPPVYYGVCTSTRRHPGTITLRPETLRLLCRDLLEELYRHGFRAVGLVSGHAGGLHMNAIKEVAEEFVEKRPEVKVAAWTVYDPSFEALAEVAETPGDSHAGEVETSLVMAIRPDLVKEPLPPEDYPSFPKPLIVEDKLKYWASGVWGNPQKATPEKGRRALEILVERNLEIVRLLKNATDE